MKKIFIVLALLLGYAVNTYAQTIAIEFREANKFNGIIGKAFLTGDSLEVVTFIEDSGRVVPNAFIYKFTENYKRGDGILNLKCVNQLGVTFSGAIDLRNALKPNINLVSNTGILLTNISDQGMKMKKRHIENIDLGM